jgi:hypothetical protein
LVTLDILEEVFIDEDMFGKVAYLQYAYHDITNVVNFPELVPHEYLELKVDPLTQQSVLVTKVWAREMERAFLGGPWFSCPFMGGFSAHGFLLMVFYFRLRNYSC